MSMEQKMQEQLEGALYHQEEECNKLNSNSFAPCRDCKRYEECKFENVCLRDFERHGDGRESFCSCGNKKGSSFQVCYECFEKGI